LRLLVGRNCVQQDQEGSEVVMRRENGYHETRSLKKSRRYRAFAADAPLPSHRDDLR